MLKDDSIIFMKYPKRQTSSPIFYINRFEHVNSIPVENKAEPSILQRSLFPVFAAARLYCANLSRYRPNRCIRWNGMLTTILAASTLRIGDRSNTIHNSCLHPTRKKLFICFSGHKPPQEVSNSLRLVTQVKSLHRT